MVRAFVSMSELARQLGADDYAISELHGWFFDGHVLVKDAFRTAVVLARLYEAGQRGARDRTGGDGQ